MQVNDIFEKNLNAIKSEDERFYKRIIEYYSNHQEQSQLICLDYLDNGDVVLSVEHENRIWCMNSRYSDETYRTIWCEQFDSSSYLAPYIIFGFGTGSYIRALKERLQETNFVLVVEPNPEIFIKVLQEIDISDILSEKNILIAVDGINDECIVEFGMCILDYGRMQTTQYGILPNYLTLYHDTWNDLRDVIKEACNREIMNRNTSILYAKEFSTNILANMMDLPIQYTINQIKDICDNEDISDVPAVIVSAGPSLDKNIKELKEAKNKAFIIATDSAIRPLLKNGIKPDVAVTVDPHKPPALFSDSRALTVPMVVCYVSNKYLWTVHRGKRFYFSEGNKFVNDIYKKYGKFLLPALDTGGSVANNCYSFAKYLGFRKIILIGQDLGYPDNIRHAYSVYGRVDTTEEKRQYTKVEDIYGNMIVTDYNMESYLRWFENQIRLYPEVKVIDATEGGAKIAGSEIITLREAIQRECKREINFEAEIEKLQPIFGKDIQEQIFDDYKRIPERLFSIKTKIKSGLKDYDKLLHLYRTKGVDSKEYQKLVKKTGKLTSMIEKEPIFSMVEIYNQLEKYQVLGEVYMVQENIDDELEKLVSSGKKMLRSYEDAIAEFAKDFDEKNCVDYEQCYKDTEALYQHVVLTLENIKEEKKDVINQNIGWMLKLLTILLDKLYKIEELLDQSKYAEQVYQQQIQLLQAHESNQYELMESIIEKNYLPVLKELMEVINQKGNRPLEEQGDM